MRQDRQLSLDGLRAICAASVVVFHAAPDVLPGGGFGVDIFFVLSGFLITRILLSERERTGGIALGRFYLSRAARLWPALLLFAGVYAVAAVVIETGAERADKLTASVFAVTYAMNWVRAFDLGPSAQLVHTWSLAAEQQFYLVWPLAILLLPRNRAQLSWAIGAVLAVFIAWRFALVAMGADVARIYNGFDTRVDGLLVGCLLASIPDGSAVHRMAGRTWGIPAACLAVLAAAHYIDGPLTMSATIVVVSALSGWLVIGLRNAEPAGLTIAPLVYLGTISYGIYLWHFPIAIVLSHYLAAPQLVIAAVTMATSAILAAGSFHFVETPARRWIMDLRVQRGATTASATPRGASGS